MNSLNTGKMFGTGTDDFSMPMPKKPKKIKATKPRKVPKLKSPKSPKPIKFGRKMV